MERVGIFGGTFDPPHRAHLLIARTACDELQLDRVLWIPAGQPPHKLDGPTAGVDHRVEMTRMMVEEDHRFELDLGEVEADGPSYTVNTLERLHEAHPDWRMYLIIGQDQFEALSNWYQPERVRKLARLMVYRRNTNGVEDPEAAPVRPPEVWLPGARIFISSSDIRMRLARGEDMDETMLPQVADYIHHHRLYLGE